MPDRQQGNGVVGAVLVAAHVVARLPREVDHVLFAVDHLADRADLIAQLGGALEAQRDRFLLHEGPQLADQLGAVAGKQLAHRGYPPLVRRGVDVADAGRRAAPDVVVQTWLVAALEHLAALAQGKQLVDQGKVDVDPVDLGKGTEVLGAVEHDGAGAEHLRVLLIGQADDGVGLAVLEIDVVARGAVLDERVLQQQRLELAVGDDHLEVRHPADQYEGLEVARRARCPGIEVGADPSPQVLGLAHVQHLTAAVLEQVDAGRARQLPRHARQIGRCRIANTHWVVV